MCKAIKNMQATDKKTMEKWVKKIGIINFLYLDTQCFLHPPPTLNLIFWEWRESVVWESESRIKNTERWNNVLKMV